MSSLTEQTVTEYFAAIRSMDAARCAALFAEDAVQHDPVGTPPNVGYEAILAFFTNVLSSFQTLDLKEDAVFVNGSSAAAKWTGIAVSPDDKTVTFEGVDVIDCNEEGKIVLVRAFWDAAPVMAILEP